MKNIKVILRVLFISIAISLTFMSTCYAQGKTNGELLSEYISTGYNGKNLDQRNTLLRFQSENNLTVDGIIGKETKKALEEENKQVVDILPEEIQNNEWFIVINKSKKILTVYKNGDVFKKYPVALGKSSAPTPDYKFIIINKVVNPYWGGMGGKFKPIKGGALKNPLGKRWLGLSTEKYRGYGIHGNSSPYSIGTYASSGCIRMINEDVEELFNYIPVKTHIWIGTEKILEEWGIKQYIKYEEEIMVKKAGNICVFRGVLHIL